LKNIRLFPEILMNKFKFLFFLLEAQFKLHCKNCYAKNLPIDNIKENFDVVIQYTENFSQPLLYYVYSTNDN
jgi:hypothetical protein